MSPPAGPPAASDGAPGPRRATSAAVIVLAKAPVSGAVKTRLVPALGPAGAARLHAQLVERTLRTARAAAIGPVELCCAPDCAHPFFARCAAEYGVALAAQGPGDLGARMLRALDRALGAAAAAVLVGSDCPAMTPEYLRAAVARVAGGYDAVLGPAEDGGYVLVAAARTDPAMFARIRWGERTVTTQQRERLRECGLRWSELPMLWDVDVPADLDRLRTAIAGAPALLAAGAPERGDET